MPVANEEETMGDIINEILSLPYEDLYLYPVIDAYSKDRTEEIIRSFEDTGRVKCIYYAASKGVISCYFEGYRQALADGADQIIEMDGGGSHKPSEIPQFMEKFDEGYECIWGSRFTEEGGMKDSPWYRKILSGGGTWLANLVLGTTLSDMTSGFEGFKRNVLEEFDFDQFLSTGHMYQTEMRFYCRDRRAVEVPIHYTSGKSSLKADSVFEALKILFCLKKNEKNVRRTTVE